LGLRRPVSSACRVSKAVTDEAIFADPGYQRFWHFG